MKDELRSARVALAALYVRGAPRPFGVPRRGWPEALRALRAAPDLRPTEALGRAGLWREALALQDARLVAWAEERLAEGRLITVLHAGYPERWLFALREGAPPALWRGGPCRAVRWLGVVGRRRPEPAAADFATDVARQAVALSFGVASGGAAGCDSAAESAALAAGGDVLRLLPHGIDVRPPEPGVMVFSVCAPDEPFSTAAAMERNALIYAACSHTVVAAARFRAGGAWTGAADALRRRLGRLVVRDDGTPAARALVSLGATPIQDAADLEAALGAPEPQPALFALG